MSYTTESHDDDTVTLRCGSITARIEGDSWRDAHDAATALGEALSAREDLRQMIRRLSSMRSIVSEMDRSLNASADHVDALNRYAYEARRRVDAAGEGE